MNETIGRVSDFTSVTIEDATIWLGVEAVMGWDDLSPKQARQLAALLITAAEKKEAWIRELMP